MNKTFNTRINRWEIDAAEGHILHRIGSDDYTENRHASVTADDLDNWEEIAVDAVPRYTKAQYHAEVERLIAERYSHGKEIEINREATTKPERFAEYLDYIEECKRRAKDMLTATPDALSEGTETTTEHNN